jgi:hypothetical protein
MCDGMSTDVLPDETDATACTTNEQCGSGTCDTTMNKCKPRTIKARFGNISCLDGNVEKHDGRIRPVFE